MSTTALKIETDKDLDRAQDRVELLEDMAFALKRIRKDLFDGELPGHHDLHILSTAQAYLEEEHADFDREVKHAEMTMKEKARRAAESARAKAAAPKKAFAREATPPAKRRGRPPGPAKRPPATTLELTGIAPSTGRKVTPQSSAITDPHPGERHRYDHVTGACVCGALAPRTKGRAAEAAASPAAPGKRLKVQMMDAEGNDLGDAMEVANV